MKIKCIKCSRSVDVPDVFLEMLIEALDADATKSILNFACENCTATPEQIMEVMGRIINKAIYRDAQNN